MLGQSPSRPRKAFLLLAVTLVPLSLAAQSADSRRGLDVGTDAFVELRDLTILGVALSGATLIAAVGLYFRRPKLVASAPAPREIPAIAPAPYDDRQLRNEILRLGQAIEQMSQQLSDVLGELDESRSPESSRPTVPVTRPEGISSRGRSSPSPSSSPSIVTSAPIEIVQEYERTRPSRGSWKDFENRYSCERFECTNVRERSSRPEEPLCFETSANGVYLAASFGSGRYVVFPFFSASPVHLYYDGAMAEVYEFPVGSRSETIHVVQAAIFTRTDRRWFLQSRGRLEE